MQIAWNIITAGNNTKPTSINMGKPVMNIFGQAKAILDNMAEGAVINVSLSDTSTVAFAVVIISRP